MEELKVINYLKIDNYSKDGLITDIQANNWILTNSELNKLIKITK